MLKHRLIIAAIGIPLLITFSLLNNPLYFILLFSLFGLIGVWEYHKMLKNIQIDIFVLIIGAFTLILCLLPLYTCLMADLGLFASLSGIFIFIIAISGIFISPPIDSESKEPIPRNFLNSALSIFVFVFYSVLFALMIQLRVWDENGGRYFLLVIFAVMAGDSGAYFAGRFLGKHLLIPAISPKKTWEGVFGNFIGNIIGGTIYYLAIFRGFTYIQIIIISVLLGFIAIFGDLIISYIKRATGVKDSGIIFPGHGGVLDRTDSILFSCLFILIIVNYMQSIGGI